MAVLENQNHKGHHGGIETSGTGNSTATKSCSSTTIIFPLSTNDWFDLHMFSSVFFSDFVELKNLPASFCAFVSAKSLCQKS